MPPPMPPSEDDPDQPTQTTTPRRPSTAKQHAPTTPDRKSADRATPKSEPSAATARKAPMSTGAKKPEPTLLSDFLLGRPSPARVAAAKRRSAELAAVKAEMRAAMRQPAVLGLPRPNPVRDRVKAWQKSNAAAMAAGDPEEVGSEPTEVIGIDGESVTEEDRMRIKMRKKVPGPGGDGSKSAESGKGKSVGAGDSKGSGPGSGDEVDGEDGGATEGKRPGPQKGEKVAGNARPRAPPKKRIVSDDNWMKRRGSRKVSPRAPAAKMKAEGAAIPKDFLQRTARNPSVQNKIKDWATRVEVPDPPASNPSSRARRYGTRPGETITVEEDRVSGGTPRSQDGTSGRTPSSRTLPDDSIRVRPVRTKAKLAHGDVDGDGDGDGIRVLPSREKAGHGDGDGEAGAVDSRRSTPRDDGVRVRPVKTKLPDGGIRVRPSRETSAVDTGLRATSPRPTSPRPTSPNRRPRVPSTRREPSPSTRREATEEPSSEPEVDTPTRKPKSRGRAKSKHAITAASSTETPTRTEDLSESRSWSSTSGSRDDASRDESDRPSSAPAKSLAEIPFGYSAFSELDLPLGADHHTAKRPRAQRNPSFKAAVPKVLKKVVSEGKKIIHDRVDPPKPVANQPPNIESWLSGTVDPFVDSAPTPGSKPVEAPQDKPLRKRTPSESGPKEPRLSAPKAEKHEDRENTDPRGQAVREPTPKKEPVATTLKSGGGLSGGLKRSRATRAPAPPHSPASKKPLREALKDVFRGESTGHRLPPMVYPSCEDDVDGDVDDGSGHSHEGERRGSRRTSSGSTRRRSPSPDRPTRSDFSSEVSTEPSLMMSGALPKRKPPTNGLHELSTIVSEGPPSTVGSETLSTLSQTTITQSTVLTRSTDLSREKSHRSHKSGLKRRLTKHSDLVSVLSIPDSADAPARAKSIRSSRSLRRKTSKMHDATLGDVLREFAEDEHFYQRELKTLVDGVVPVLLNQVVQGQGGAASDLFGPEAGDGRPSTGTMGKAVVDMGVALEKLRSHHKRAPLHDPERLLTWLDNVAAVYDRYLDVWRLGFQGLIVNLAPALARLDDEDSLLNAMDRNEEGDVLNEDGERVDVAYLLKRPLARIKGLLKFVKAARALGVPLHEIPRLVGVFEALLEKARRRHKEETARKTDEDANNTNTSHCLDLRNLVSVKGVRVDRSRQVNAKDIFFLELAHSNGQKLECRVELVFRDKPAEPADRGDVLIRETGNGHASLLFPPIPASAMSARNGNASGHLVAMVRGRHNGIDWHELLNLTADNDEQAEDWLGILGTEPTPPSAPRNPTLASSPAQSPGRATVGSPPRGHSPGAPEGIESPGGDGESPKLSTPSRYHKRNQSAPLTPASSTDATLGVSSSSSEKTPTQASYLKPTARHATSAPPVKSESRPLAEDMQPDPAKLTRSPNTATFREDGPPRPPVHRTLGSKQPLSPPVDLAASRIKRRTSSPLKHEFHPSDISSESESDSLISDSESSSDELDEDEVPDPVPSISIRKPEDSPADSVVSDNTLSPSNSASRVGAPEPRRKDPEDIVRSVASISYWSNKKGQWRDVWHEACSVIISPGLIEVHPLNAAHLVHSPGALKSTDSSDIDAEIEAGAVRPLIALDLTPLVMMRQSTTIDLEIRSPVRSYSKLNKIDGGIFRFRAPSPVEGATLYTAVHRSRMNNAKFKALEEETRIRSFGQQQASQDADGQSSSSHRRSWFGRRNSYRASTRAPSQSQGSSSGVSAPSLLKRLTGGGNLSFNIDRSSVDRQSRSGSGSGGTSQYTSGSSSTGTPLRSPSVSIARSGVSGLAQLLGSDNLKIRCHLLVSSNKWEDRGNCNLTITRPPPGMRQELRGFHGMEKRVIVTTISKKKDSSEKPLVVLDVVLGSRCFSRLGSRGIILNVWEDLRDEHNNVGSVPAAGGVSGKVKKWCFQCSSVQQANWIFGLVAQEVFVG